MSRRDIEVIPVGPTTTIGARCDGEKIELTVAHENLFLVREITALRAVALAGDLIRFSQQMLAKAERDRLPS
jgi:hypothetical protein